MFDTAVEVPSYRPPGDDVGDEGVPFPVAHGSPEAPPPDDGQGDDEGDGPGGEGPGCEGPDGAGPDGAGPDGAGPGRHDEEPAPGGGQEPDDDRAAWSENWPNDWPGEHEWDDPAAAGPEPDGPPPPPEDGDAARSE
jgi:hypothetical protein